LEKTVDFFLKRGSNVNLGSIDISKAFDKVNRYILFDKLKTKNCPEKFILILQCWLSKSTTTVKWNGHFSIPISLSCGVRQGSILAPYLFAIYVDNILCKLHSVNVGCHIHFTNFNSLMYADDLLLIALTLKDLTLKDLQLMVNICSEELEKIDMRSNAKKSACMRVGDRFDVKLADILKNQTPIPWCHEISYLGLVLVAGRKLNYSFHIKKAKYFGAVNSVLGKIGTCNNAGLVLSLMASKCSPILAYNLEALSLPKSTLSHLCYVYSAIYSKLFKTFDKTIIAQCQLQFGYLPLVFELDLKRLNFLHKLSLTEDSPASLLFNLVAKDDLTKINKKYGIKNEDSLSERRQAIWDAFRSSLNA